MQGNYVTKDHKLSHCSTSNTKFYINKQRYKTILDFLIPILVLAILET